MKSWIFLEGWNPFMTPHFIYSFDRKEGRPVEKPGKLDALNQNQTKQLDQGAQA
jgi:hypothetical protein